MEKKVSPLALSVWFLAPGLSSNQANTLTPHTVQRPTIALRKSIQLSQLKQGKTNYTAPNATAKNGSQYGEKHTALKLISEHNSQQGKTSQIAYA